MQDDSLRHSLGERVKEFTAQTRSSTTAAFTMTYNF